MRLIYFLLLVFVLGQASVVSAVSVSSSKASAQEFETAQVQASHLNVRTGPGLRFHVIQSLPKGTEVTVLEPEQDGVVQDNETWSKVTATVAGTTIIGWVCDRYLVDNVAEPDVTPVRLPKDEPALEGVVAPSTDTAAEARAERNSGVDVSNPALSSGTPTDPALPNLPDLLTTPLKIVPNTSNGGVSQPNVSTTTQTKLGKAASGTEESDNLPIVLAENPLTASAAAKTEMDTPPIPEPDSIDKSLFPVAQDASPIRTVSPDLASAPNFPEINAALPSAAGGVTTPANLNGGPLSYETRSFQCRRGFFFAGIESCTAEVNVILSVPEEFLAFAGTIVPVTCTISFTFTVGEEEQERVEDYTQRFEVELIEGRGERQIFQRIDFAYRLNDVSDVRLAETSCIAGK